MSFWCSPTDLDVPTLNGQILNLKTTNVMISPSTNSSQPVWKDFLGWRCEEQKTKHASKKFHVHKENEQTIV